MIDAADPGFFPGLRFLKWPPDKVDNVFAKSTLWDDLKETPLEFEEKRNTSIHSLQEKDTRP